MKKNIIGVMGPGGNISKSLQQAAFQLGEQIALNGWVLLSGGRNAGVMDAVNQGAKRQNGLTVGVLPSANSEIVSDFVDVPIFTGMGSARNNINILSSDVVIACGMGAGTASEVALAIKAKKPIILFQVDELSVQFFQKLDTSVFATNDLDEVIRQIKQLIK